jgi:hypothetical protein
MLDDPAHWRERAIEARSLAEEMQDPVARRMMSEIAEQYARMAEWVARRQSEDREPTG